jgi:hypothetical protein
MKIEEGKYYRMINGDVVGPMRRNPKQCEFPWFCHTDEWRENGLHDDYGSDYELISEVYVSDTPPADVPSPPLAMLKPQEWRRLKPIEPSPETKTLRDEFADTALKAMLTRHADFPRALAQNAYEYADAMMEARKKCTG